MAQSIKLKRSAIAGRVPTTSNLDLGELAINVRDGKLYFKRDDSTIQTILTTNSIINGDLTMVGDVTGSDVYIDGWGSISGSLANIQAGHFNASDVDTVYGTVKNVSGGPLLKGTPLAVVAGQTQGNVSDVVPADASDPALMPAVYILNEDLADQAEGEAVIYGRISGIDTSAFSSGDTVYVAPGGGWTTTKPVHPNKIQNLGIITKAHATNGGGEVMGAGRSNDLPNLTPGKVWVGTSTYPTESTTIHLDETNGRLGINALAPGNKLTVHDASQNYPVRIGNNTANVDGSWTGIAFKNSTNTGGGSTYEDSAIRAYRYSAGHELELRVNNTSALRINAAGNVGIGTTAPSEKLEVAGNIKLLDKLTFTEHSTNDYVLAETYALAISGEQSVNFRVGGANVYNVYGTQIRPQVDNTVDLGHTGYGWKTVRAAGNITTSTGAVGIGTQYPQYALEVVKDSTNTSMLTRITNTNAAGRAGITFALPNNNNQMYSIGVDSDRSFKIGENNLGSNTRFVITAAGNVGIGTTSPTAKLDIAAGLGGSETLLMVGNNGNGNIKTRHIEGKLHNSTADGILHLNYYASEDVSIVAGGGNVKVGAGVATEKLDVDGNIKSSGTIAATGAITSNGVDVLDNAVAMAIALG